MNKTKSRSSLFLLIIFSWSSNSDSRQICPNPSLYQLPSTDSADKAEVPSHLYSTSILSVCQKDKQPISFFKQKFHIKLLPSYSYRSITKIRR